MSRHLLGDGPVQCREGAGRSIDIRRSVPRYGQSEPGGP